MYAVYTCIVYVQKVSTKGIHTHIQIQHITVYVLIRCVCNSCKLGRSRTGIPKNTHTVISTQANVIYHIIEVQVMQISMLYIGSAQWYVNGYVVK
jgi:hypothetical protein